MSTPLDWVKATFYASSVAPPFWYIEILLGLYLALPVFAYMRAYLGPRWRRPFGYVTVLAIFAGAALPLIRTAWYDAGGQFQLPLGGYIMFMLIGYYLAHTDIPRVWRWVMYGAGLVAAVVFIAVGGPLSLAKSPFAEQIIGYTTLVAVCIASAVFVAAKQLPARWQRANAIARTVGTWTFGIYLMHYLVLAVFTHIRPIGGVIEAIVYAGGVWIVCALLTAIARKNAFVRRWILP
ncbi:acyltransferase [Nanchangia anserum]|uniref:acyltransferase n=1 Tax=Nanchangia anserum TaxID=2692125 RepID=UPI0018848765|nr:acyltransferase [Nanchangia anserum]QOX82125.1 acyltransferase [Nanchangia anserum]